MGYQGINTKMKLTFFVQDFFVPREHFWGNHMGKDMESQFAGR